MAQQQNQKPSPSQSIGKDQKDSKTIPDIKPQSPGVRDNDPAQLDERESEVDSDMDQPSDSDRA